MKKILIVEDDLLIRGIYRRKFELSGYQVEVAEDGPTALRLVDSFQPDVLQVDIQMPGMSGVDVIREVRSRAAFKTTPIIVLSSLYRPDLAKEAWAAGATKCVSKADCTPNLAVDLVEQALSGETRVFGPGFKPNAPEKIPMPRLADDTSFLTRTTGAKTVSKPTLPKFALSEMGQSDNSPALPSRAPAAPRVPAAGAPTPIPGIQEGEPTIPRGSSQTIFITKMMASRKQAAGASPEPGTVPSEEAPTQPAEQGEAEAETAVPNSGASSEFRLEIRQEFLRRAPQLQADIRDRVGALIRSKSPAEQLTLLNELGSGIASLSSLAGVTGFSRLSHLSGAMDALIKDIQKKPSQMTSSVLRTIAHAADCLNVLFRELGQVNEEFPQSALILAVDDEPISRRTISVALSKANLRCVALEDPKIALTIVKENPFDLIFLDAEMPGLTGFELCAEIRKLPSNKTTPVIFVTSLTKFEVRAQSSLAGGSDLIAKPFLMMELAVKSLTYLLKAKPATPKEEVPA
jgi:CheY-like chemotaxis protein